MLRAWIESISKKPEPVAKPRAEFVDEDRDVNPDDALPSSVAKAASDRRERQNNDDHLADENFFRKLLRELHEDTSKSGDVNRSTSDE